MNRGQNEVGFLKWNEGIKPAGLSTSIFKESGEMLAVEIAEVLRSFWENEAVNYRLG